MAQQYALGKPARTLTAGERQELVGEVRENIEEAYNYERDNRVEAEIDLQFLAGDQWPEAVKAARGTTRPMLTINQLPQFVHLVTNPTREADIAIKAIPVGGTADPEKARLFNDLIKQIEFQSTAKSVYVTGNEHQASCGIGWWQVLTQYVDDAIFDQEIRIRRIEHPLSVYCDPGAVEPDRSDAMWIAIVEMWPRSRFKRQYPNAAISDVDAPSPGSPTLQFQWSTADAVAVAMYFRKVAVKKTLALTQSGKTLDVTGWTEAQLAPASQADPIVGTRECDTYKVEKYLVSGREVLEGPVEWAGKYIPLVPVIGGEIPLKGGCKRFGVVRFARDPQQLFNFMRTAAAESVALAPKAPYLATPKQIGPHKHLWDTMNTENRPYLLYNPDQEAAGPPKREHPPETPVALIQQAQDASEDMNRTTGVYPSSYGARSNETSGTAIGRREAQTFTANSHFSDNLVHSLVHTGRILIDLIPKIYDNERVVRLRDDNDQEYTETINQVVMGLDGQPVVLNDLSVGRFDVRVSVTKASVTKRIEAVNAMMELAKGLAPDMQMLLLDLIVENSDWPGAEKVAKRFRNMLPPQALVDPDDPEAPPPPSPMDDPMNVAALEKLAAEIDKIRRDAEKVTAETYKTLIEADQLDAELGTISLPKVTGSVPSVPPRPNGALSPPI